ncbi:hypothetical protein CSUB01_04602 [Colletotrichum sublineola]|uniref:Uncharacterized protein n=1 Tax=Colletotrichum sublineola TaxID=1173701 RepID=A0A066X0A5_COLSU|nr:hypothetical protein CSUB01_04602 [Colletotrichum sublineola]
MPTDDVFNNLSYMVALLLQSMEPATAGSREDKAMSQAALRCRMLLRLHEHVQSLAQNEDNKSYIEGLLPLLEPRLAKAANIASMAPEEEGEERFLPSWGGRDATRHFKGWLTKNFDKWEDVVGKQDEGNVTAAAAAAAAAEDTRKDDAPSDVEAITALADDLAISSPDAAHDNDDNGVVVVVSPRRRANKSNAAHGAAALKPAAPSSDVQRPPPQEAIAPASEPQPPPAIVTPPPALTPLPAEYYVFARARSARGLARQNLDKAKKEAKKAKDAYYDAAGGGFKGFEGSGGRSSGISNSSSAEASRNYTTACVKEMEASQALAEAEGKVEAAKAVFATWAREQRRERMRQGEGGGEVH